MKNIKPKVTVGIPVHNEVSNIGYLLQSIIRQRKTYFELEKIVVVCDGSTDGTDKKVEEKARKNSIIHIVKDRKRKGKMARLMEIYDMNKSDFIFIFDGDVVLAKTDVIENMIKHFNKDNIAVVGGNNQPVTEIGFIEKLISKWSHIWYLARSEYNKGDNIHNIRGCVMGIRANFARTIKFPNDIVSDAQYIYFYLLKKGLKFKFAKNAVVYYRKPDNVKDYFLQTKRSSSEQEKLASLFGESIKEKYRIPLANKLLAFLKMLNNEPFYTSLATGFYLLSIIFPYRRINLTDEKLWKSVQSTKRAITINSF